MPSPTTEVMFTSGASHPKTAFNPYANAKYPTRRQAAAMSTVGGAMSMTGPLGIFLGLPFQIPDAVYDIYDTYKTWRKNNKYQNAANIGHVVLDIPNYIPYFKFDDVSNMLGIIDDGIYSLTGKQTEEHVKDAIKAIKIRRSLENAGRIQNYRVLCIILVLYVVISFILYGQHS